MEKNLQEWITEITQPHEHEAFLASFQRDPAATLQERSFNLHDTYREKLMGLSPKQREGLAQILDEIAASPPQNLCKVYAKYASMYERFFGWEGLQEEGPRGWV